MFEFYVGRTLCAFDESNDKFFEIEAGDCIDYRLTTTDGKVYNCEINHIYETYISITESIDSDEEWVCETVNIDDIDEIVEL